MVTGGTGALGSAVVKALIERGATCHLPVRKSDSAGSEERVSVTAGVDMTSEEQVAGYYQALPPLWGSVHVCGGFAMAPLVETAAAEFEFMMRLNALTCFLSCREAARSMRGSGDGGRIVNVAARPALSPVGGMCAYAASKAAVLSLTRCAAAELAGDRILVNAIIPSIIDTPANRKAMPDADHGAWPKPSELAATIVTLVAPDGGIPSGAAVPVYGRA